MAVPNDPMLTCINASLSAGNGGALTPISLGLFYNV
jgi:hypothetical protein